MQRFPEVFSIPQLNKTDIEELKRHGGVLSLYASRVQLKREGQELTGLCPFHSEKTPSFRVSTHQGVLVWKCFGCNKSGDIIKFFQELDGLNFKDAVQKIKDQLGHSFADTKKASSTFSSLSEPIKPAITYGLEDFKKYEDALAVSQEGQDWLKSRGIGYETAKQLHVGFRETLKGSALKNWICFPSIVGDRILSIKYRNTGEKTFLKHPGMCKGEQTPLFNSDTIEPLEPVYLVEGEPDCLIMEQAEFHSTSIQSSSTSLTSSNKEKLLEADYIILAGDNTPDGNACMDKIWAELQERVYKFVWPEGMKDANQTFIEFCKGDVPTFQKLVEDLTAKAKANLMPGVSNLRETFKSAQRVNTQDSPFRWRWPWPSVDSMVTIMPGSVVYISATNTGMGKTTMMMEASLYNARRGEVILNYSAELSDQEYAQIAVSHLLKKDRHQLTKEDYDKAYTLLAGSRYYIGRNNDLNRVMDVLDLLEAAIRRSGAGTVILDTIHFVTTNESDTIKAQENAMNRIKSLSQKYGVKWFNLGQPRKANQQFKGKATHITDAKGSEMLISASDAAFAIHRNCAKVDDPSKPPKEPYEALTQIFLQKGRSLGTGSAYTELIFNGDICTFFPVAKEEPQVSKLFNGE
jgi:hypothetical protein